MATTLAYGTVILFIATILNRGMAFYNQIALMKYVGAESIGLFQMVYPMYLFFLVVATAGLPFALTKRIAEESAHSQWGNVRRLMKVSTLVMATCGVLVTMGAVLIIPYLFPTWIVDVRAEAALWALLPSILIVCASSAVRSLCQGLQSMEPSAFGSLAEQVVRIASGLWLALWLLPRGPAWAAAGIALGITFGEFMGLIVITLLSGPFLFQRLAAFWRGFRMPTSLSHRAAWCTLWPLAYPIALSRMVLCLMFAVDAVLIPRVLQESGLTQAEATSAFGRFNGAAAPLISIPTVFTIPLSISLIPSISENYVLNQMETVKHRTLKAIRFTAIIGWPMVIMLFLLGDELCRRIFGITDLGSALSILAFGALFLYIQQTTTSILQGIGRVLFPLAVTTVAFFLRIFIFIYVASLPQFRLDGIAWAYTVSNGITAILHLLWFRYRLHWSWKALLPAVTPALGAVAFIIVFFLSSTFFSSNSLVSLMASCLLGLLAYLLMLPWLGCLSIDDLRSFPGYHRFRKYFPF
ncbi:putative polysaccharide biosynthesis protein [Heliophilum fasciatum]|uniref:Stage V sporulation protein B n=1 Tax=Heliophilum fasciatum TaxID=35700 RepID=A0A4R2RSC6_9FIRM|nr:polysaccharide biosynthesis protein [Heliophilum fasciatum]MCW2278922.1 stage V sporulation protein B [Heliophilum fasciatum]TCP62055.1 stage V sporulation protein B [Heliophilum fasciatum]